MATSPLTRGRRLQAYLTQAWAERGSGTPSEPSAGDESTQLCSKCKFISAKLEEILMALDLEVYECYYPRKNVVTRQLSEAGGRVTDQGDLEHVVSASLKQKNRCSLCNFLGHMVETYRVGQGHWWAASELSLYIGSAKWHYGINSESAFNAAVPASRLSAAYDQDTKVDESHLLCIWPTKRSGVHSDIKILPYTHDRKYGSSGMALELSNDRTKISGRLIGPQANFEVLRSWFDECAIHHSKTRQTDASVPQEIPGFMVIDCVSRRLVSWSQLPDTQDRNYVALSYVWGTEADAERERKASWVTWFKDGILRGAETEETPRASLDYDIDRQLPSHLPRLIEDAITAVVKLQFRYLWVDRYCIPQDQDETKHTQIQNMDKIYGSAALTIIAAAGKDPSNGLPGVSPRSGLSNSVRIGSRTFVTVGTGDTPETIEHSKWNTRAWTMQEAYLSCRCLVFLENGAFFQCSSFPIPRYESIHEAPAMVKNPAAHIDMLLRNPIISTRRKGDLGHIGYGWCLQLVKDYFLRSTTFEEDSLNAFAGILKHLQSLKPPVHHLWGVLMLPPTTPTTTGYTTSYSLIPGLAWTYRRDQHLYHDKLRQPTIFPRKGIFPSWSWVDWRSQTAVDGQDFTSDHQLKILDSGFRSTVDLSVELDDGTNSPWGKEKYSDESNITVNRLASLPQAPRVLKLHAYTSHPHLRYITEEQWGELCDGTFGSMDQMKYHGQHERQPNGHFLGCEGGRKWVLIDADGKHLHRPFETAGAYTPPRKPWCWAQRPGFIARNLSIDAYQIQLQRESRTVADLETFHSSTFSFRAILLGSSYTKVYFMILMKVSEAKNGTETFERVNVIELPLPQHVEVLGTGDESWFAMHEFICDLEGMPFNSSGTPWDRMSTRIA